MDKTNTIPRCCHYEALRLQSIIDSHTGAISIFEAAQAFESADRYRAARRVWRRRYRAYVRGAGGPLW